MNQLIFRYQVSLFGEFKHSITQHSLDDFSIDGKLTILVDSFLIVTVFMIATILLLLIISCQWALFEWRFIIILVDHHFKNRLIIVTRCYFVKANRSSLLIFTGDEKALGICAKGLWSRLFSSMRLDHRNDIQSVKNQLVQL